MRKALWLLALVCVIGCSSGKKADPAAAAAKGEKSDQSSKSEAAGQKVPATSQAGVTAATKPMIEQATQLILKRDFGKAFEQLDAAIKADPKCAAAYFMRAGILADAGLDLRAVADFNKAIGLDPQNPDFYSARGFYYMTRQQYQPAVKDFSVTLKLNPVHTQACNNRGIAYVALGQYKPAIADFREALKQNPQNFDAYNNRGFAYFQSGDIEHALSDYDAALRINENCLDAYNNKGMAHYKAEQYDLAAEDFSQAIQRDKLNAKYYRSRREAYLKAGKDSEARADLDQIAWLQQLARLHQIVSKSPNDPDAWTQRGVQLVKGGEFEAAAKDFQKALKLDPKSAGAYLGLAELDFQQGKTNEALAECDKAAKLGAAEEAASLRGDIYMKLNQLDSAISSFEEAQRFDTKVAEAYLLRSQARKAKGQVQEAEEDYRQALSLDPSVEKSRQ